MFGRRTVVCVLAAIVACAAAAAAAVPALPAPVYRTVAVVNAGAIYVLGGHDVAGATVSGVEVFDPATGYSINLPTSKIKDAIWKYASPYDAVKEIAGHVAFYDGKEGITVERGH